MLPSGISVSTIQILIEGALETQLPQVPSGSSMVCEQRSPQQSYKETRPLTSATAVQNTTLKLHSHTQGALANHFAIITFNYSH